MSPTMEKSLARNTKARSTTAVPRKLSIDTPLSWFTFPISITPGFTTKLNETSPSLKRLRSPSLSSPYELETLFAFTHQIYTMLTIDYAFVGSVTLNFELDIKKKQTYTILTDVKWVFNIDDKV